MDAKESDSRIELRRRAYAPGLQPGVPEDRV
jgi:hypothetical protein